VAFHRSDYARAAAEAKASRMLRALVLSLLIATPAVAAPKVAGLEVRGAWSRPAAAGTTGVGYAVVVNHGRKPAVLVGAETPIAAHGETHRSVMAGGVMSMTAEPRVEIPAGGELAFAPGGRHLMFVGLRRALKPGDVLPATLIFADGRRLKVGFAVGNGLGPPAPRPRQ
jgi:hypothetical protein